MPQSIQGPRQALVWGTLAAGLFGVMALLARFTSPYVAGPQMAFMRFAVGALVVAFVMRFTRVDLRPRRIGWPIARGVFGGSAVLCYFSCIEHIGVGLATLLNYTAPVWSLGIAWILLGERPPLRAFGALLLTIPGVLLVANSGSDALHAPSGWVLVGMVSALFSSIAVTSIRAVRRTDHGEVEGSWTVFASFTFIGMLATLPGIVGPLGTWHTPGLVGWVLLLSTVGVSIVAQLLMTASLKHLTAALSGILNQLAVVISLVGGILLFQEPFTLRRLLGSGLTLAGVAWAVLSKTPKATES